VNAPAAALAHAVARELQLRPRDVEATLGLLLGGATVPFIARYRKEATGGLDETQIRAIEARHAYVADLEERRRTILESLVERGLLTDALRQAITQADTKTTLEDLYLPYRPKRRTRATQARERGLGPLAERLLAQPLDTTPEAEAARFVSAEHDVPDVAAALAGARDIVAERVAETPQLRALARELLERQGEVTSRVVPKKRAEAAKFESYFDHAEPARSVPSHRWLALMRGEAEGLLSVSLEVEPRPILEAAAGKLGMRTRSPWAKALATAILDGVERLLLPSVETDVRAVITERAHQAAIDVFASNLRDLLLAPPAGARRVVAVDPGLRTGAKCVALDAQGNYLAHLVVYPVKGESPAALGRFVAQHQPELVAVGNGTGSREAEAFVAEVVDRRVVPVVSVSEAGASVYSASPLAVEELPDLDVTVRGAVSIGRRLQDPLAELVKIDPASIGVGQYQHDVDGARLAHALDAVVESAVSHVGVDLDTASPALLARVPGIGPKLAHKIVEHRKKHGRFRARRALLDVSGLGPRAFEQCAGFLRIKGGDDPLDASAVHPERYALVGRIARDLGLPLSGLVQDAAAIARIEVARYVGEGVGEPTLVDIVRELAKPGRDPRAVFEAPRFSATVRTLEDVQPGMLLEGVVTNVTAFGAFVDVGVHQDGLVHVSQLADRFVKDPREVAKVGARVKVRVLEVDRVKKRIALSMKALSGPV
jgi:uncharacterized protein